MKCLVTTLKDKVENNNLPILDINIEIDFTNTRVIDAAISGVRPFPWVKGVNCSAYLIEVPSIKRGKTIDFTNSSSYAVLAFLKSIDNYESAESGVTIPDYSDVTNTPMQLAPGVQKVYNIPTDCNYILINKYLNSSVDRTPVKVVLK